MFSNRLHLACSFGLNIFEAESMDDLTVEQYETLVEAVIQESQKTQDKVSRTVSIRTKH